MTDDEIKQRLEKAYDFLYDAASAVLEKYKPCGWRKTNKKHRGVPMKYECIGMSPFSGNNTPQCCCEGCPFWKDGCTAEKPLACKTWLCNLAMMNVEPIAKKKLAEIAKKAIDLNLYVHRGDRTKSIAAAMLSALWQRNEIIGKLSNGNLLVLDN